VAIVEDGALLSEQYTHTGLTHSETLLPMIEASLRCAKLTLENIDAFTVTTGPGSFTGIRIGIAAVKGMAVAREKPCMGISTLEAIAYNLLGQDCLACCAMDARREQVYTALFDCGREEIKRLTPDAALPLVELGLLLQETARRSIIFVGDGAPLCYQAFAEQLTDAFLAPEHLRYQRAAGAAFAVLRNQIFCSAEELLPQYLRLPQAERELRKREEGSA